MDVGTPGKWSRELPESLGWYWFRRDMFTPRYMAQSVPCVVRVSIRWGTFVVAFPQGAWKVAEMAGEWCGPLPEPLDSGA